MRMAICDALLYRASAKRLLAFVNHRDHGARSDTASIHDVRAVDPDMSVFKPVGAAARDFHKGHPVKVGRFWGMKES